MVGHNNRLGKDIGMETQNLLWWAYSSSTDALKQCQVYQW